MPTNYIIGMDIGGTNTDAVLIDRSNQLLAAYKAPTSQDIVSGFCSALQGLFRQTAVKPHEIGALIVGTTHATNAILQCNDLYRCGVIRIAGQKPGLLPACYAWPKRLKEAVFASSQTIDGGYEFNGRPINPFSAEQAREAVHQLLESGSESIAIIGVFSPMINWQELMIAEIVREIAGYKFPISLSHSIGGMGFIERENTTLLNAALKKVMETGFRQLEDAILKLDLTCPLFITQNNGSLIDLAYAIENPVLTISSGPTNSFIGASRLMDLRHAVVVDIGGTSTDVGIIQNGFPRRSLNTSNIGGIDLNFSMPDVLSIALGGGSHVEMDGHGSATVGPFSVGKDLFKNSISFGGQTLTLTDAALRFGCLTIEGTDPRAVPLTRDHAKNVMQNCIHRIEKEINIMEADKKDLPILLVGGGARLFPEALLNRRCLIPEYGHVANAYGAALAEVTGCHDQVVSLTKREETLDKLKGQVLEKAILNGADPKNVHVVDMQIIPYNYVQDSMARVVLTAAGPRKW